MSDDSPKRPSRTSVLCEKASQIIKREELREKQIRQGLNERSYLNLIRHEEEERIRKEREAIENDPFRMKLIREDH